MSLTSHSCAIKTPHNASKIPPQSSIIEALNSNIPIILDGALATHLESLGADLSGSLWSASILASNPSLIYQTHLSYFRSGAQIATTASYQASIPGLVKHLGIEDYKAEELVRKSVELAQQARDDYLRETSEENDKRPEGQGERDAENNKIKELYIAGSIGPYGAYLANGSEYNGSYALSTSALQYFHRSRIATLISSGCDILAIETIPSFPETEALLSLLTTEFPDIPAWFTFTTRDTQHIGDGAPISRVLSALETSPQVVAVGVNCVHEDSVTETLHEIKKWTKKPLIVYPNSGETWNAEERKWYGERKEGERLAERVQEWWEAGARIIGGCCRTRPEDITVIAETLAKLSSSLQ